MGCGSRGVRCRDRRAWLIPCASASALIILLTLCSSWLSPVGASAKSCTIFTISNGETVLFGNNEDHYDPGTVIEFSPATKTSHGLVRFGFRRDDGSFNLQGVVNDQGLVWDGNGLPPARLNPHPEKTYSYRKDNYLNRIAREAATVEEAIRISRDFDFDHVHLEGRMTYQIHIADATGDAVVISAGPDGEVAYTRKPPGNSYLISTNFNLANPENGAKSWRYDKAAASLSGLLESTDMTLEDAVGVLDEVHLEDLISQTMYSNAIDLKNGVIALSYMARFDDMVYLDIDEELAKGARIEELRDRFSAETAEAGEAAYRRLAMKSRLSKAAAVVVLFALIVSAFLLVRSIRRSRRASRAVR